MGLDVYLSKYVGEGNLRDLTHYTLDRGSWETVEMDSKKYPSHMFKIGYFRSSYNDSGIDRVLNAQGLPTLNTIFEVPSSNYYVIVDWERSKERVTFLIEQFKERTERYPFMVCRNFLNFESAITSGDAIKLVIEKLKKQTKSSFTRYICKQGMFFLDKPLKVRGVITGEGGLGPEMFLVYEVSKETFRWYLQALEIVEETIDYVLAQEDRDKYFFRWSA